MVKAVFDRMMKGVQELRRDLKRDGWHEHVTRNGTVVLRSPTLVEHLAKKEAKKPK